MKKILLYMHRRIVFLILFTLIFSCSVEDNEAFSERTKIALREVGNQLLLKNQDSTSLILPVIAVNHSTYKLAFEKQLSFEPNSLVSLVDSVFQKAMFPNHYRVEVMRCTDLEVAYSYQMTAIEETTIIPCAGRVLPKSCYTIQVKFTNKKGTVFSKLVFFYSYTIGVLLLLVWYFYKKKQTVNPNKDRESYLIGSFQFYPEQNKLVKQATEISLSKKECELLAIFVAQPNQIIRRDELTKKVWEDNGVVVGRSLDTYISKLRKILQADDTIKLTNIHGIGYKLETE